MKAVVWTKYGKPDVLQLREVEKPSPKDNEVLIRVRAATVTAGDCEVRRLEFSFFLRLIMRLYLGVIRPKKVKILGENFDPGMPTEPFRWRDKLTTREDQLKYLENGERYWFSKEGFGSEKRKTPA